MNWSWFGLNDDLFKKDAAIFKKISAGLKDSTMSVDGLVASMKNLSPEGLKTAQAINKTSADVNKLAPAFDAAAASLSAMTTKAKAAEIGMKALSVAKNMLIAFGIGVTIDVVLKGLDYLIHRQEKATEAAANLKSEYDSLNSEVISLGDEIKTTSARIDELLGKGSLSIVEQEELTRLQLTNVELERQVKLKEMLAKETGKEAEKAAVKAYNLDDKTINVIDAFG